MKYLLWIFFILMISIICAVCENNQIDINSASLEKLDELTGIGPAKAQAIIDARDFDSIADLIDVYGIGPATLEKIKTQGLACVNKEEKQEAEDEKDELISSIFPEVLKQQESISNKEDKVELEIITLNSQNSKDIKSENIIENSRTNYAKYGFIGFCILIVALFILKKPKSEID